MSTNKFQYWPSNGQLGSTKFTMPTNAEDWPSGDALVGNFVYSEGKLVDFIDTKGLTPNTSKSTTIPYDYVNIELPFAEDAMTINRGPRSKYLFIKFNDKEVEEGGSVIVTLKYKGCKTVDDVIVVDPDYQTTDIVDGVWSEGLGDLTNGNGMFYKCDNLTTFSSDLSNLTDGSHMFDWCPNLTSFNGDLSSLTNGKSMFFSTNITSFSSDLSSLTNGEEMFQQCEKLTSFSSDLPSLTNGYYMFYYCTQLTSFSIDLPNLTDGGDMFSSCEKLISFASDLSSLSYAWSMFAGCSKLTSFTSDLPSLTEGHSMFRYCENLESFSSNLSSLTNGEEMFYSCSKLTSFDTDLSSLTNGYKMFLDCSNLTSFSSDLSNLIDGDWMFDECKLDAPSIRNIIDTINTFPGQLYLGMGCNKTTEDKDLFAQEVGYSDMSSLLAALKSKSWTVSVQYSGRPTTTYGLRRPSEDTLPVFVKLEEIEETEKNAKYTSEDGSKKYRLDWFHETTGSTEGYTQFNSLEEAVTHFNIKPVERI